MSKLAPTAISEASALRGWLRAAWGRRTVIACASLGLVLSAFSANLPAAADTTTNCQSITFVRPAAERHNSNYGTLESTSGHDASLDIQGYSISGDGSQATITLSLGAPPSPPSNFAALWIVTWRTATADNFAAYVMNQPDPTGKFAPTEKHTGYFDAKAYNGTGGFVDDPSATEGMSAIVSGSQLVFSVPYGDRAGPQFRVSGTQASAYAEGVDFIVQVPSPYAVQSEWKSGRKADSAPTGSDPHFAETGPIGNGNPFCGSGPGQQVATPHDAPLPGTLTLLTKTLPNDFVTAQEGGKEVGVAVDAANNMLFEIDNFQPQGVSHCQGLSPAYVVRHALDSFDRQAAGCVPASAGDNTNAGINDNFAVDPADRVLFLWSTTGSGGIGIVAVSEDTLVPVAAVDIPAVTQSGGRPPATVHGMYWDAARRELFVEYQATSSGASDEVVAAFAASDRDQPLTLADEWAVDVPQCGNGLQRNMSGGHLARAVESDAVYLGCLQVTPNLDVAGGTHTQNAHAAMDKLVLQSQGCASGVKVCPTPTGVDPKTGRLTQPQVVVTVLPDTGNTYYMDPMAERAYWTTLGNSAGASLLVYDGGKSAGPAQPSRAPSIIGRTAIGTATSGAGSTGADPNTGRFYAFTGGVGALLVDGRRTPVSPGTGFPAFSLRSASSPTLVVDPTLAAPYTRLLVPATDDGNSLPYFHVYADEVPVTTDPAAGDPDLFTYHGPIAPGDHLFLSTYSAQARAYGVHSDFVGSTDNFVNNTGAGSQNQATGAFAPGTGTRDVMGGLVWSLTSTDSGGNTGDATAARDMDTRTSDVLKHCSDAYNRAQCAKAPPGSGLPDPQASPLTEGGSPDSTGTSETGQQWPFLTAFCPGTPNADGSPGDSSASQTGIYRTTYHAAKDANGQQYYQADDQQSKVPGTDGIARARVNCADVANGASGDAALGGFLLDAAPSAPAGNTPRISIGQAVSATSLTPPGKLVGALIRASAAARGISIAFPDGSRLDIGSVTHYGSAFADGMPHGATTAEALQIADVVVTAASSPLGAAPAPQVICQGICADNAQAIDAINSNFPALMRIDVPSSSTTDSPGGAVSTLKANDAQSRSDQQFNAMSPEEAGIAPGLRIVIYNDGSYGQSREVLDLAGVFLYAAVGQGLIPAPVAITGGSSSTIGSTGSDGTQPSVHQTCVITDASGHKQTIDASDPSNCTTKRVITKTIRGKPAIPGRPAVPGRPGHAAPARHHVLGGIRLAAAHLPKPVADAVQRATSPGSPGGNLENVLEKLFSGFGVRLRDLKSLLTMFSFLLLLALPMILMLRREMWLRAADEG